MSSRECSCGPMSQWRRPGNVKAWLYRSVRNAAIDRRRLEKRRHLFEERQAVEYRPGLQHRTMICWTRRPSRRRSTASRPEQRELIVLRVWGEMAFREISEVTGLSISTLFSRYQAALVALREAMERPR